MGDAEDVSSLEWSQLECHGSLDRRVLERSCHTATVSGNFVYVIGGKRSRGQVCGDVLRLNLTTHSWESVFAPATCPFLGRFNHSAVLLGTNLWLLGGMSQSHVFQDCHVLDTNTLEWRTPTLKGNPLLLRRCYHGCCVHPQEQHTILLFGGFGGRQPAEAGVAGAFLNDLVAINTLMNTVEVVKATSARALPPRAHHTFTAAGGKCYAVGGRNMGGQLAGPHFVEVFDPRSSRWVAPASFTGPMPAPRSSHKAVGWGGAVLLTGGTSSATAAAAAARGGQAAGAGQPADANKCGDALLLSATEGKGGALTLSWRVVGAGRAKAGGYPARSAHAMVVHGQRVLLLMGYRQDKTHVGDCWVLQHPSAAAPPNPHPAPKSSANLSPDPPAGGAAPTTNALLPTTPAAAAATATATPAATPATTRQSAAARGNGLLSRLTTPRTWTKMGRGAAAAPAAAAAAAAAGAGAAASTSPAAKRPSPAAAGPEWHSVKRSRALAPAGPVTSPGAGPGSGWRPLGAATEVLDLSALDDPVDPGANHPNGDAPAPAMPAGPHRAADAVYIRKIKQLEEQVSALQASNKELRGSDATRGVRCMELEAQLQDARQGAERLQQALAGRAQEVSSKEDQVQALQAEVAQCREQLGQREQELQRAQREAGCTRDELQQVQRDGQARQAAAQQEVEELKHQVAARGASSQRYQALADQRRQECEVARQQGAELQQRLQEMAAQLSAVTQAKQQLEGVLQEKESSLTRLAADVAKLTEELKQQCVAAERRIAEQAASYDQLRGEHTSLHATHQKLQDTANSLSRAMEAAQAELSEERRARTAAAEAHAKQLDESQQKLQAAEQKLAEAGPEMDRLRAHESSTTGEVARLQQELGVSRERETALEEQAAAAATEVTKLRGENYNLSRQVDTLRTTSSPLLADAESVQAALGTLIQKLQEHRTALLPGTETS